MFVSTQRSGSSAEEQNIDGWRKGHGTHGKGRQKKLDCVPQDIVAPASTPMLRKGRYSSRSNLRLRYTSDALRSLTQRQQSVWKKGSRCRATITSTETAGASCDLWHPSICQNYISPSGCKFGEKSSFLHREADRQPNRRPKKGGGKGCVALLKNAKQLGCTFQDIGPPKFKSV